MSLPVGRKLGPYEIEAQLGAGGMGEVYRARDTRLDRTVAVKVLPAHLSSDAQLRQRFEREARAVSSLNHPNICSLFDIGSDGGVDFLVMEHLDGETLADTIQRGPLPVEQILRVGIEIADALDRAHRSGIVHRDLKPGNIILTKSGTKLLDFGLAKGITGSAPSALTATPTVATPLTAEGTIVGTFQYMAPEQLEGGEADARSDIFAFGAVLYEMTTGRRAFEGKTQASLIASILKEQPRPAADLQPPTPPALDRVIRQCLAKDPDDRWQSAGDLMRELKWIASGDASASAVLPATAAPARRAPAWLLSAGAVVLALGMLGLGWFLRPAPPVEVLRASLLLPEGTALDSDNTSVALSPDGSRLAYAGASIGGRQQIWVRPMNSLAAQSLAGTEGASYPFWSPDGAFIGFFADRKLKKIPSSGGTVQTITDATDGRGASWGADGVIVFAPGPYGGLRQVSASGGTASAATTSESERQSHRNPRFLPDGRRLLFFAGVNPGDENNGIHLLDVASGETTLVASEDSEGIYVEPGYLLFVRDRNLMARPIDPDTLQPAGEAVPIAEGVHFNPYRWTGTYTVSGDGRLLLYQAGTLLRKSRLTWFDRDGKTLDTIGDPAMLEPLGGFALSPDGRRTAVTVRDEEGKLDLWMYDLARGVSSRFTFAPSPDALPVWSPDGTRVAYIDGAGSVFIKAADGASEPATLYKGEGTSVLTGDWSPDGSVLVLWAQRGATGWDVLRLRSDGNGAPEPLIATPANEIQPRISPDGRWILWVSDESGRQELFLAPYPGLGGKWQISSGGAAAGMWLGDGSEIAYLTLENQLIAVTVTPRAGNVEIGASRPLFGGRPAPGPVRPAGDGSRLLAIVPEAGASAPALTLVVDWTADLPRP